MCWFKYLLLFSSTIFASVFITLYFLVDSWPAHSFSYKLPLEPWPPPNAHWFQSEMLSFQLAPGMIRHKKCMKFLRQKNLFFFVEKLTREYSLTWSIFVASSFSKFSILSSYKSKFFFYQNEWHYTPNILILTVARCSFLCSCESSAFSRSKLSFIEFRFADWGLKIKNFHIKHKTSQQQNPTTHVRISEDLFRAHPLALFLSAYTSLSDLSLAFPAALPIAIFRDHGLFSVEQYWPPVIASLR